MKVAQQSDHLFISATIGSDRSVGVAGGWLQGGGHGALSPSLGLGVDRVVSTIPFTKKRGV